MTEFKSGFVPLSARRAEGAGPSNLDTVIADVDSRHRAALSHLAEMSQGDPVGPETLEAMRQRDARPNIGRVAIEAIAMGTRRVISRLGRIGLAASASGHVPQHLRPEAALAAY